MPKKNKTLHLCVFVLLFLGFNTTMHAQQKELDSLKAVLLNKSIHDTTRLLTMAWIIEYCEPNNAEARYYTDKIGELALKNLKKKGLNTELKNKYTSYMAMYYNNMAVEYGTVGNFKALDYYDKSIKAFRSIKYDSEANYAIVGKGIYLAQLKKYPEAIESYFKALRYFELKPKENADGISYVNSSIGVAYSDQENHEKAIKYNKKALDYYTQKGTLGMEDMNQKCMVLNNIGTSYFSLKNYPQAGIYFNQALPLAENAVPHLQSYILVKLGLLKLYTQDFAAALKLYQKALLLADNDKSKANCIINLGEAYYKMGNYKEAENYTKEALRLSTKANIIELQKQSVLQLYYIYKALKNDSKALAMFELHDKYKDSVNVEAAKNSLVQQQQRYDFEKKELQSKLKSERKLSAIKIENERQNTRKDVILAIIAMLLIVLIISAFYGYKFFKQKNIISANKNNELRQKLLRTQMNPHFIFNSIDNIQALIYADKSDDAVSYLNKFSKLTRQILENSDENFISLQEEVSMTANYLSIQQLLYNNSFTYTIHVDDAIQPETLLIPPMLTQPFIENAIKHGLHQRHEGGNVRVHFYMDGDALFFEVTDNGPGIEDKVAETGHRSMATQIVNERLKNSPGKKENTVIVSNVLQDNAIQGVAAKFEIPFIYDL